MPIIDLSKFSMDKQTFEKIYLEYYPVLLVYGKAIVADETWVEDAIQELFLHLWQKEQQLLITSSLENYLLVSLRNNLIRKAKKQKKSNTIPVSIDLEVSEKLLEKEQELQTLLKKLPTRQKEVLFLRYYKNKSYQEIADTLGISYQKVKPSDYSAWKDGMVVFNKKLSEVVKDLEILYGVRFTIEKEDLKNRFIQLSAPSDSIEQVLNTLELMYSEEISIETNGQQIRIF